MNPQVEERTFVEVALALGGKGADESRRTGTLDRADEQVEAMFATRHQTAASPIHWAVWTGQLPVDLFAADPVETPDDCRRAMDAAIAVVARHKAEGTLLDEAGKVAEEVLRDLGAVGYWGLLVDREYGGLGCPFAAFATFLTRMATVDPTVAGFGSVHGCIGAVDPLRGFGDPSQKGHFLPRLARGDRLSAFALTEPGAGSDLTALKTTAVLDDDHYVIDGEKLFITNAVLGRTIGLVCLIDGRPAVLIVDLPDREDETFQLVGYGLHALRRSHNNGLRFRGFRVPAANLLKADRGDGLTIAYHGLNLGRVALCANAAGTMRRMLADLLPWASYRRTYGAPIGDRELVLRRVGRLAGLIVGCDALVAWCAGLLDRGYRGEMECIVAKVFGSEAQKEAAVELAMKTHGGRAFLVGHDFGDNVHEYLAPCIYEGEGEILGLGLFKSLVKDHGRTFFEPIGRALQAHQIRTPNPLNPAHAWALKGAALPYALWRAGEALAPRRRTTWPEGMPANLRGHAAFAGRILEASRGEISRAMARHQLRFADRQCRMSELSGRVQDAVVMLATSLWATGQESPVVRDAADVLCRDLSRKLSGRRPSDDDFRAATRLGREVAAGGFPGLDEITPAPILRKPADEPRVPAFA